MKVLKKKNIDRKSKAVSENEFSNVFGNFSNAVGKIMIKKILDFHSGERGKVVKKLVGLKLELLP